MKDREIFDEYATDIINNELYISSKQIFSHGAINIYDHSIHVAETAFTMIEENQSIDKRCVVRAALLHDFFLYEWHIPGMRYILHGHVHAGIAAENARRVFNIGDREYSCIKTHMWPWTLLHPPLCREGWIINLADKIVAVSEIVFHRGRRHRLKDPAVSSGDDNRTTAEP